MLQDLSREIEVVGGAVAHDVVKDDRFAVGRRLAEADVALDDRLEDQVIQRNIRLSEAPSHGKPIILYDIMCNGSTNYLNLAREVLEHNGETV